jgi:iron complex transport system permease protein
MVVGVVVGASLSTAGVLLQALLRNPLASPFILGISSGAGLGVMAALYFAHETGRALAVGPSIPATAGALATLGIVYALARRRGWLDPVSLVLIGVVMSTICAAGIMFFQHLVTTGLLGDFTRWLMGSIPEGAPARTLLGSGAVAVIGVAVAALMGRAMDAATLGDDEARSVGLKLRPLRVAMFVLAGVLTAMTVALAGPIGFVGLIAPHLGRLVLGPKHTPLVIGAALIGIVLVVGADVVRQAIDLGGGRMPIGIFTALIGGPVFIWLLRTGRGGA